MPMLFTGSLHQPDASADGPHGLDRREYQQGHHRSPGRFACGSPSCSAIDALLLDRLHDVRPDRMGASHDSTARCPTRRSIMESRTVFGIPRSVLLNILCSENASTGAAS